MKLESLNLCLRPKYSVSCCYPPYLEFILKTNIKNNKFSDGFLKYFIILNSHLFSHSLSPSIKEKKYSLLTTLYPLLTIMPVTL